MASERQISVGGVTIGGGAPVVVQSMTLTKTHDVEATTAQIAALASAGCEVVRVAVPLLERLDFHDFKISVKSSHVPTMIRAYRMLSAKVPYPLHLGVTEAGTPFSGSIKSAVGMGALLVDGIGDTMRVSLTADPVEEVKTAYEILKALGLRERGPIMIACPSCGRDNVGVQTLAEKVEARLHAYPQHFEDPADAEAVSHKLLVRGGFIRQLAGGLWTFMPLGWRVHRKIEQIIREELDAFGAQEIFMPVLTPAELWEATGRIGIPELFRLKDRAGRDFILPLTHEETITFHARELRSYKELPQIWYHFQTKGRDEPRPRGGLLRVREFIMKDGYSFDRDEEGLERSFRLHAAAYERIFERCGIETYGVQAESGMMGGSESFDYLAPSGSGENTLVTCERGDYAADLEIARGVPRAPELPDRLDAPAEVGTPGATTIEALADYLGIDPAATSKAMPVTKQDGAVVLALVRGDDRLNEAKLQAALGEDFRPATEDEIRTAFGADPGSLGPIGFAGEVIADETLREGQFVAGANRTGWHLLGVEAGRDFEPRF